MCPCILSDPSLRASCGLRYIGCPTNSGVSSEDLAVLTTKVAVRRAGIISATIPKKN